MITYQHGWFIHFESKLLLGKSGDSRQYKQNGSNLRRSQKSTFLRLLICHFWPIFALAQTRKQCLYPDANSRICRYVHAFSLCQTLESKRFFFAFKCKNIRTPLTISMNADNCRICRFIAYFRLFNDSVHGGGSMSFNRSLHWFFRTGLHTMKMFFHLLWPPMTFRSDIPLTNFLFWWQGVRDSEKETFQI